MGKEHTMQLLVEQLYPFFFKGYNCFIRILSFRTFYSFKAKFMITGFICIAKCYEQYVLTKTKSYNGTLQGFYFCPYNFHAINRIF